MAYVTSTQAKCIRTEPSQPFANHLLAVAHPRRQEGARRQVERGVVRGARKVDVQALPRRGACRQPLWPQRDPPLADTPRRLERARGQERERLDAGPRPVRANHRRGERRLLDLVGRRALAPPADGAHRVGGGPRVARLGDGLIPRRMQPLCGRVGLLGRRVEIWRRVGASVVPLVQRPLADGVEALGRAVEPVLDAVRVVEDLVALLEPVLCPRIRIRLDLHALDRVSDPQAGGGDRVAPHLEHPILNPVRRLGAPSQNVRAVEPQRGHLAKQLLLDDERRRPDGLQALKVALRPAVLDHRIVPRRCMHVPESVRRRQRRRVGGGVSREVGHRLCEDVVRLGH
mmetsp:Transcript_23668/g.78635  ORF Transcript_23668/g.78635 Transcript_23668/m.78635 type:complete len:344 (-) Transcript_23668:401-1432(-)